MFGFGGNTSDIKVKAADSNDLRTAYIQMAQGKKITDIENIDNLSANDLRFLAYFLSNYYVPWSTTLDNTQEDSAKKVKEAMSGILVSNMGFDKTMANAIVQKVFNLALSTARPLFFKWKIDASEEKTLGTDIMLLDGSDPGDDDCLFTFDCMYKTDMSDPDKDHIINIRWGRLTEGDSGKLVGIHSRYNGALTRFPNTSKAIGSTNYTENSSFEGIYRASYGVFMNYFAKRTESDATGTTGFYWAEDASTVEKDVGDPEHLALQLNEATLASYMMCCEKLSASQGQMGTSMYSMKKDDMKGKSLDTIRTKLCTQTAPLYVDWVGNIFVDNGVDRIIILPACLNPNTMNRISNGKNSSGEEVEFAPYQTVNLVNLYSYLCLDNIGKNGENGLKYKYNGDRTSLFGFDTIGKNKKEFVVTKGSNDTSFDDTEGDAVGTDDVFSAAVQVQSTHTCPNTIWIWGHGNSTGEDKDWGSWSHRFSVSGEEHTSKNYNAYIIDSICSVDGSDIKGYVEGDSENNGSSILRGNLLDAIGGNGSIEISKGSFSYAKADELDSVITDLGNVSGGYLQMVYLTYLFAFINELSMEDGDTTFDESINYVDMQTNLGNFPESVEELDWGDIEVDSSEMQQELMSMMYYLMHPSKGIEYFSTWLKNKVQGFFLGWHEDIVGGTNSNASTGTTSYIGFTGYTTIPNLHDLSWTDWVLGIYNNIIIYVIIFMLMILCCYVIVGNLTLQKGIIGILLFAVCIVLPPIGINATVDAVNNSSDLIYGKKFQYWALVQHQSHIDEVVKGINDAKNVDDLDTFKIGNMIKSTGTGTNNNSYTGVKLKWMSPKKDNLFASEIDEVREKSKNYDLHADMFLQNILNSSSDMTGEEFTDSSNPLYLYRDYMDITTYALKSYNFYDVFNGGGKVSFASGDFNMVIRDRWNKNNLYEMSTVSGVRIAQLLRASYGGKTISGTKDMQAYKDVSSSNGVFHGFQFNTLGDVGSDSEISQYFTENTMAVNYLLNSTEALTNIYKTGEKLSKLIEQSSKIKPYSDTKMNGYGIPQYNFNFTSSDFNVNATDKYSDKTNVDHFYYGIYSESPFYFFTYNIIDQMKASVGYSYAMTKDVEAGGGKNFRTLLLSNNLDYFYNYSDNAGNGYGELRDFMNIHDLFYYIIPCLENGNRNVEAFADAYDMKLYSDVKVNLTGNGLVQVLDENGDSVVISDITESAKFLSDATTSDGESVTWAEISKDWTSEKKFKFWHNYNVITIFNEYCTWVDTMFDCQYAKSQQISVTGESYTVENPLDPTSYFTVSDKGVMDKGRPMIFSESEMKYYGLKRSDLTTVEQKIVDTQKQVYEKSINLLNYSNMDDDVLISALAMEELFAFNQNFSQTSLVGSSYNMYPTSYELKLFSYDAYMRLILSNATGDDLQSSKNESLYTRIGNKTSLLFGIVLVVNDALCVYIIPAFRLFFLVVIFFMAILMIIASALSIKLNVINTFFKSLIVPLLQFFGISLGLTWVVSLFMSNGATGVTGDTAANISLGDPTMTIIALLVINAISILLYFKLSKKCFSEFIKYFKAIGSNVFGNIAGALSKVTGLALAGKAVGSLRRGVAGAGGVGGTGSGFGSGFGGRGSSGGIAGGVAGGVAGGAVGGIAGAEASKTIAENGDVPKKDHARPEDMPSKELPKEEREKREKSNKFQGLVDKGEEKRARRSTKPKEGLDGMANNLAKQSETKKTKANNAHNKMTSKDATGVMGRASQNYQTAKNAAERAKANRQRVMSDKNASLGTKLASINASRRARLNQAGKKVGQAKAFTKAQGTRLKGAVDYASNTVGSTVDSARSTLYRQTGRAVNFAKNNKATNYVRSNVADYRNANRLNRQIENSYRYHK